MDQDSGRRGRAAALRLLGLSSKYENLLAYGDTKGRYGGDGSCVVGAIILDAVRRGCDRELLFAALSDEQNLGGFSCMRRHRSNIRRWFEADWKRAQRRVPSSRSLRNDVRFCVQELRELADRLCWKGVGGATDHATFLALLAIASRIGRFEDFDASVRELAEMAGVGAMTVSRYLKRLVKRRLVWLESSAHGAKPATWTLRAGRRAEMCRTDTNRTHGQAEPVKPAETRSFHEICAGSFDTGLLIHAAWGRSGGIGGLLTNRSGWAA